MDLVIPDKDQSLIDAVNACKEDIEELGKKIICLLLQNIAFSILRGESGGTTPALSPFNFFAEG